ncbi:hypothetical protein ElyMa_000838700 [Elysia marginata]|uniref:Uncharacterized protein n=1 Tax=Elysia marginata TaxID=1093978 RepID=A0AAV4H367_9GAST|nr:hypothetical protein ElyMa_000838700 [Elysia marginata]
MFTTKWRRVQNSSNTVNFYSSAIGYAMLYSNVGLLGVTSYINLCSQRKENSSNITHCTFYWSIIVKANVLRPLSNDCVPSGILIARLATGTRPTERFVLLYTD